MKGLYQQKIETSKVSNMKKHIDINYFTEKLRKDATRRIKDSCFYCQYVPRKNDAKLNI